MTFPPFFPHANSYFTPVQQEQEEQSEATSSVTTTTTTTLKPRLSSEDKEVVELLLGMSKFYSQQVSSAEEDSSLASSSNSTIESQPETSWEKPPTRTVSMDDAEKHCSPLQRALRRRSPPVEFVQLKEEKPIQAHLKKSSLYNYQTPVPAQYQQVQAPRNPFLRLSPAVITPVMNHQNRPIISFPTPNGGVFNVNTLANNLGIPAMDNKIRPSLSFPSPTPTSASSFPRLPPLLSMKREKKRLGVAMQKEENCTGAVANKAPRNLAQEKKLKKQAKTQTPTKKPKKFSWKNYPQLEDFLIANRHEYLSHSAQNYTLEQKDYNNTLTARLIDYAEECGYGNLLSSEFQQDFGGSFTTVRDRIRGYYKSFMQSNRRREERRRRRLEKMQQKRGIPAV